MEPIKVNLIKYKGKGNHTASELEKMVVQRDVIMKFLETTKPVNITVGSVRQFFCVCTKTTQINEINDKWICCTCNKPVQQ